MELTIDKLIQKLRASNKEALESMAEGIARYSKLPHDEIGLELLLRDTIAEILYIPEKSNKPVVLICTSNVGLTNRLGNKDKDKKQFQLNLESKQVNNSHTNKNRKKIVKTFELQNLRNPTRTLNVTDPKHWAINRLLVIDEKYVKYLTEAIDQIIHEQKPERK